MPTHLALELLSSIPRRVTVVLPVVTEWWGPITNPARGHGSRPGTSRSSTRPANLPLVSSDHTQLRKSSTPHGSIFGFLGLLRYIRHSMFLKLGPSRTALYACLLLRDLLPYLQWRSGIHVQPCFGCPALGSWSPVSGGWIGRVTVQGNAPESLVPSFWTLPSVTSTGPIRIGVQDRQAAVVKGWYCHHVSGRSSPPPLCS